MPKWDLTAGKAISKEIKRELAQIQIVTQELKLARHKADAAWKKRDMVTYRTWHERASKILERLTKIHTRSTASSSPGTR